MAMIWQVKDLLLTLQRDFKPDQLIAFSIMGEPDVGRRLGVSGVLLEAIMIELMRLVDQSEPVLAQYLEEAYKSALDSLKPETQTTCVCCSSHDVVMSLALHVDGTLMSLWFCASCMDASNIFVDATPVEVFHSEATADTVTPNFRNYLLRRNRAIIWVEFEKEFKR